jgi:hypothetical protein
VVLLFPDIVALDKQIESDEENSKPAVKAGSGLDLPARERRLIKEGFQFQEGNLRAKKH